MKALDMSNQANPFDSERYKQRRDAILTHPEVVNFVSDHHMTDVQVNRSLSKFSEYITESKKYAIGDAAYVAKGYRPVLIMNEGYADVVYQETEGLRSARHEQAVRNRIRLMGLPNSLKAITTEDLDTKDENRLPALSYIKDVIKQSPEAIKGLYLYGNFGVGKSYLMAYMAQRLSRQKGLATTMVHVPTFIMDLKKGFEDNTTAEQVMSVKTAEILVLDDIGAETPTAWVRDAILQVILQYRMQENLLTFFTSNLSMRELERYYADTRSGNGDWEAKRLMERITYLAQEMPLKGVNRRHE